MNENQLKSFLLAADEKSFSKAAGKAFISGPALVQQINLLEKNLGFTLFVRKHTGIELTDAGAIFYDAAQKILDIYNDAKDAALQLESRQNSVLRICYTQEMLPRIFSDMLHLFTQAHPEIKPQFQSCNYIDFFDLIRNDRTDIAILTEPSEKYLDKLKFFPVMREKFAFCMKAENPLSKKEIIHAKDLTHTTILCGRTNYMKVPFEEYFKDIGNIIVTNDNYDLTAEFNQLGKDNAYLITNQWKEYHSSILKVIPSDIDAGMIGFIYREKTPKPVRTFLDFWQTTRDGFLALQ